MFAPHPPILPLPLEQVHLEVGYKDIIPQLLGDELVNGFQTALRPIVDVVTMVQDDLRVWIHRKKFKCISCCREIRDGGTVAQDSIEICYV